MATSYLVMLVYIANCFIHAESVKCIRCSSTDYNSPCRLGTDETLYECPSDEQSCYAEYFYGGSKPLYRRGCSNSNWCEYQKNQHGDDFKYCKTCDGEKCNTATIGGPDSSQIQCYTCSSEDIYSDCKKGGIDNKIQLCEKGIKKCFNEYIATSKREIWTRGCARDDYCSSQESKYGQSLQFCKYCHDDLCNT
ncbi:unnamed protein product [Psylliodes chrysocephalus]|uniref:Sodefrin-like factor n=1 Tax=Psylliodes chrysocephalus TaxID=3402493 RepID=A0A9P0GIB7_9CUCU|nr:unnamed protein product [Psylliodes chrysocephala]